MVPEPDSLCLCGACGRRTQLLFADCLSRGWPECCGQTMTVIASPRPSASAYSPPSPAPERDDGSAASRLATT
jgi:hypothetical protein